MRWLPIFLSFAVIDLFFSTFLFNGLQYLSLLASFGLVLLDVLAALLFILPRLYAHVPEEAGRQKEKALWALVCFSCLLIAYEYTFALAIFSPLLFLVAALLSLGGIYVLGRVTDSKNQTRAYLALLVGALIITFLVYTLVIGTGAAVGKSDELAFNYYAAGLFLNAQNPYLTSMKPALSLYYGARPTVRLDGSIEEAYIYPAFSFISLAPFSALFGASSISPLYGATIFLCVCSALIVYETSGRNKAALLPIGVWLFFVFTRVSVIVEYLGVSFLLLLAFACRKRPLLAGVFAGLAAGTTQLAWFALPFFLVLTLREQGRGALRRLFASTCIVFLAVNGYYLLTSPIQTLSSLIGTFGSLPPTGSTLFQLLLLVYPVAYSFSSAIFVLSFLLLLLAFYFYTDSLRPLMAVAPFIIFLLSWRNLSVYGLPFVPLILAVYYDSRETKTSDAVAYKKLVTLALLGLLLLSFAALLYSHSRYVQTNPLAVGNLTFVQYVENGVGANVLLIGVRNNASFSMNVSFEIFSLNPASVIAVSAYQGYNSIAADSYYNFPVEYSLPDINRGTQMSVLAFSSSAVTYASKGVLWARAAQ